MRTPRDRLSCHARRAQGTGPVPLAAAGRRAPCPRHPASNASVDLLVPGTAGPGLVPQRRRQSPAGHRVRHLPRHRLPLPRRGIKVLTAQAPDLHQTLTRVCEQGWSHVALDGKLFATDRLTEAITSVKGNTIDAWYSGKHRDFGANIQAITRPDGLPVWTSETLPGHLHDLTCTQQQDIDGALYWAASQLNLPTLADTGYQGTGKGIHTPIKQPADGGPLATDNRAYNTLIRSELEAVLRKDSRHIVEAAVVVWAGQGAARSPGGRLRVVAGVNSRNGRAVLGDRVEARCRPRRCGAGLLRAWLAVVITLLPPS